VPGSAPVGEDNRTPLLVPWSPGALEGGGGGGGGKVRSSSGVVDGGGWWWQGIRGGGGSGGGGGDGGDSGSSWMSSTAVGAAATAATSIWGGARGDADSAAGGVAEVACGEGCTFVLTTDGGGCTSCIQLNALRFNP
jgi:collagen type III alpha